MMKRKPLCSHNSMIRKGKKNPFYYFHRLLSNSNLFPSSASSTQCHVMVKVVSNTILRVVSSGEWKKCVRMKRKSFLGLFMSLSSTLRNVTIRQHLLLPVVFSVTQCYAMQFHDPTKTTAFTFPSLWLRMHCNVMILHCIIELNILTGVSENKNVFNMP